MHTSSNKVNSRVISYNGRVTSSNRTTAQKSKNQIASINYISHAGVKNQVSQNSSNQPFLSKKSNVRDTAVIGTGVPEINDKQQVLPARVNVRSSYHTYSVNSKPPIPKQKTQAQVQTRTPMHQMAGAELHANWTTSNQLSQKTQSHFFQGQNLQKRRTSPAMQYASANSSNPPARQNINNTNSSNNTYTYNNFNAVSNNLQKTIINGGSDHSHQPMGRNGEFRGLGGKSAMPYHNKGAMLATSNHARTNANSSLNVLSHQEEVQNSYNNRFPGIRGEQIQSQERRRLENCDSEADISITNSSVQDSQSFAKKANTTGMSKKPKRPSSTEFRETQMRLINDLPPPYVSSTNWCIIDRPSGQLLFGRDEQESKQVASMTKIMTANVVLDLIDKYSELHKIEMQKRLEEDSDQENNCTIARSNVYKGIVHLDAIVKIPYSAASLNGTTAHLIGHDFLTVRQLMYGMMLPSGNDAAQALALWFGAVMLTDGKVDPNSFLHVVSRNAIDEKIRELQNVDSDSDCQKPRQLNLMILRSTLPNQIKQWREESALKRFLREMNNTAMNLGMKGSNFAVSHGMHHDDNYSCALDIANLSKHALDKHPTLREVVNTKTFTLQSMTEPGYVYSWSNTNYLLWDDSGCYQGIKTGVTPTAGPCLSVLYSSRPQTNSIDQQSFESIEELSQLQKLTKKKDEKVGGFEFILVIMNTKTREARFTEIPKLVDWAQQKIMKVSKLNYQIEIKRMLLRKLTHF